MGGSFSRSHNLTCGAHAAFAHPDHRAKAVMMGSVKKKMIGLEQLDSMAFRRLLCSSYCRVRCLRPVSFVIRLALLDRSTSSRVSGSSTTMTTKTSSAMMPCHQNTQRHPRAVFATVQADAAEPMACDIRTVSTKTDIGKDRLALGHMSATNLCKLSTNAKVRQLSLAHGHGSVL